MGFIMPTIRKFIKVLHQFRNTIITRVFQSILSFYPLSNLFFGVGLFFLCIVMYLYRTEVIRQSILPADSNPFYVKVTALREQLFWDCVETYPERVKQRMYTIFNSTDHYLISCYLVVMTGYCVGLPPVLGEHMMHAVAMTLDPYFLIQIVDAAGREYFMYPPHWFPFNEVLCQERAWMFNNKFRDLVPPPLPCGFQHQARLLLTQMFIELYQNNLIGSNEMRIFGENLNYGGRMRIR